MDIVKAFTTNTETISINIQGTTENPLFQANQIGEFLGIKNIRMTIQNFDEDEKCVISTYTLGGEQNVTFLTEFGLYKLLGMSRKPFAKEFNKWVYQVIKEIRLTGKYELETELKNVIEKNKLDTELMRHKTLMETCKETAGVYIGKIKEIDNNIIVKIGSTHDIVKRSKDLRKYFGNFILFDFFEATRYRAFETDILRDPSILKYQYKEPINNNVSVEVFSIPLEFYNDLVLIIQRKQKNHQGLTEEHLFELEMKKKEIELIQKKKELETIELQKLELQNNLPLTPITNDIIHVPDTKQIKVKRGCKIQKYTTTGEYIKTYHSLIEAIRIEEKDTDNKISISGLKKAIEKKTIYKGFRWLYLNRDLPDDTLQDIGESKNIINQNLELIAMLDINKENIINVFPDQKTAAQSRNLKSVCGIQNSIRLNRLCSGHYFCHFSKCSDELKTKYLLYNTLPAIPRRHNAIKVKQLNPITNEVINEYNSYEDIRIKFQIGAKKLKTVIKDGEVYKGFKWSY